MADVQWYYVSAEGTQAGPLTEAGLTQAFRNKTITEQTLVWNENMANWAEVGSLPSLLAIVKPPPVKRGPPPVSRRGPPPGGRRGPPMGSPPAAAAEEKVVDIEVPEQEEQERVIQWKEYTTPEGLTYYHNAESGQTTWEKPDVLKTPDELDKKGEWVWFPVDNDKAFIPARVTNRMPNGSVSVESEDGQAFTLKAAHASQLQPLQWSQLRRLESDMVLLDIMSKPLIIYNLRQRFLNNEIYTNVGTILVSVNPYKMLPLYTPATIDKYRHKGSRRLPPHVFEIADNAYNSAMDFSKGQAIVISGESGAGKTEATKQCLQFLAEVAGSDNNVEQKILVANPILEAFGNAKTVRNNNSSRFGKYVEIFFNARGNISGSKITNYLLEKIRVVAQNDGERNFHIFYQLTRGDPALAARMKLSAPEQHHYLNQATTEVDGMDDVEEWGVLGNAFNLLSFSQKEIDCILNIVGGIIHMGDIRFRKAGDRKCEVESKEPLNNAAALLQIAPDKLASAITSKTMRMRGQEDITITLSDKESVDSRDAMAKFVYEGLFDWLVVRINKSIGQGTDKLSIGILDIFGFEIFQTNYMEQLCINFTNEKLQQYFNQHTFALEEAMYKSEQIQFVHVEYIDNQPVLDLIEKSPTGILPMIDEEIRIPRGNDQTYVRKLHARHADTPQFASIITHPEDFIVKHYAGAVHYMSEGFLEKNKDRLNDDTFEAVQSTKMPFLKALFPEKADAQNNKLTLSRKFTGQLNELMRQLNMVNPHYIRCIKPNPNKQALEFNGNMVLEQLQYSGVFEAIEIRKQGYPFRLSHEEFVKRFKCVVPSENFKGSYKEGARRLITILKQDPQKVQIGTTRVLYRAEQHRQMELIRNVAVEKVVIFIGKWVRRFLAQRLLKKIRELAPKLRAAMQKCQQSRNVDEIDKAVAMAARVTPFHEMKEVKDLKWLKHCITEEQKVSKQLANLLAQGNYEANYEALSRLVASANEIQLKSKEADQARKIVGEIKEKRAVAAALKSGVEEYDEDKLRLNLEKAQQLGVQEGVDKAYEMLVALIKEKQYLYDSAIEQLQVLEEGPMQDVLSRADGIKYSTPEIEQLRTLLLDTPEEKFVQMQLKAAVANNDPARGIRVTIRLKDLFFKKSGDMFVFDKFSLLRDRMQWAGMKFISFSREELAATQLYHTMNPIHASLTQLDSRLNKMAKTLFKNVMGFMGDRQLDGPDQLAIELIKTCLQEEGLRDEIYCQIIKQLTRNPNQGSLARGWNLMAVCLESFPPRKQFENYLETYLRTNSQPPERFVTLLHQCLYGGPANVPPSPDDIRRICEGQSVRGYDVAYTAEERAEAKQAMAFGGLGVESAGTGIEVSVKRPSIRAALGGAVSPAAAYGAASPIGSPAPMPVSSPPAGRGPPPGGPPPGGPPGRGPPPGGPPGRGPPPGGPPPGGPPGRGPPPGGPPGRGPPPGGPPGRGPPPGGPPGRGPPPGGPPGRGPPPGGPPGRGPPPGGPPSRGPPPGGRGGPPGRGPPPGRPPMGAPPGRGPPPGRAPPQGPPPGRSFAAPAAAMRAPMRGPPMGPPPGGAPPGRGPPPGKPPGMMGRGPPMGAPPGAAGPGHRRQPSERPIVPEHPRDPNKSIPGFAPPAAAPARPMGFRLPPRGAPPPRAAPAPKKEPDWQIVKHPETGEPYYWNTKTNEVSWDKPASYDGD